MKAKEVLQVLRVTRPTLTKYVKDGLIKVVVKSNGQYDYDTDSVYEFLNKDVERKTYIYARVSSMRHSRNLDSQLSLLKGFCIENGYKLDGIYKDVGGTISFENRSQFFELLDEVLAGKVKRVLVTTEDRISQMEFELFSYLFAKFGCEIITISEVGVTEIDVGEVFEEIVDLLRPYSIKLDVSHKNKVIKELFGDDDYTTS